jgi:hypothetical protein
MSKGVYKQVRSGGARRGGKRLKGLSTGSPA